MLIPVTVLLKYSFGFVFPLANDPLLNPGLFLRPSHQTDKNN
jgi:hypothetical protein